MPGQNHMIRVPWSASGHTRTRSVYQYDYGQVLSLEGFPEGMLPEIFEMHFSSDGGRSVSVLGKNREVSVPDICLRKWQAVKAWLFLHDTEDDGETRYAVEIPVRPRALIPAENPEPVPQDAVTQAVAALNAAVVRAESAAALLENVSAAAETLPTGSPAAAAYSGGVFSFGIPRGLRGLPGEQGRPGEAGPESSSRADPANADAAVRTSRAAGSPRAAS